MAVSVGSYFSFPSQKPYCEAFTSQHDPLFHPGDGCVSSAAGEVTPTYTIPKTVMRTLKIKRDDLNKNCHYAD